MVLGLRTKSRKGPAVHVDYRVLIQEIKPWPPSQSLKNLRSVLLQWENGDKNTGSTKPVVPFLGSGVGEGKIEFNESFRVPVTLCRELSMKGGDNADTFVKNCLELNLYELRSNKSVKGQLLGTVIVDLAEYGILKETVIVSAPVNCKRSFRNTAQPVLFMKIEPFQKKISRSASMESLPKYASLEKDGRESVAALMSGEYDEETEIASFTDDDDDDISQHSSLTVSSSAYEATGSSPPQSEENACEAVTDNTEKDACSPDMPLEPEDTKEGGNPMTETNEHLSRSSSHSSLVESSSEVAKPENGQDSLPNFTVTTSKLQSRASANDTVQSPSSSIDHEEENGICLNRSTNFDVEHALQENHEEKSNCQSTLELTAPVPLMENQTNDPETKILSTEEDKQCSTETKFTAEESKICLEQSRVMADGALNINDLHAVLEEEIDAKNQMDNEHNQQIEEEGAHATDVEASSDSSRDAATILVEAVGDAATSSKVIEVGDNHFTGAKLKHVKSVRSLVDSYRNKRVDSNGQYTIEPKETSNSVDANGSEMCMTQNVRNNTIAFSRDVNNYGSEDKVQQLEQRIERLERELKEAAALEVALYSVVAEHGSSANKVHAPARRLSRLYFHACKGSRKRRATAARSAVSGLVLVAKACGNDVARLTFWLSNSVVLRAIISLALDDSQLPVSAGPHIQTNAGSKRFDKVSSSLKWEEFSSRKNQYKLDVAESTDDWEETHMFTTALEKIEAWIFSRIIESIWWQTLTPHMQTSTKENEEKILSSMRNCFGKRPGLSNQEQAHFSMELWKKAFKDACDRLCPVRAAGHQCGCLPVLSRLVMEQCVNRLDVAMFNAILRESADDIPTDPVSDPISDSKVLPIPAGESSFGAGAQLKNAIGNWSRGLSDLFGIDYDDSNDISEEDNTHNYESSSKSFHLLNALSDLMMLPKDMLLNESIRKEVCPTFGAPLIKRVLDSFSPDEFCPDPIPLEVFRALDVEDSLGEEESLREFPCEATPVMYSPPSAAFLATFIGESGNESQLRRSGSSVLRKSYTSDDELDELDSPLASISDSFRHKTSWKVKENGVASVVRYELLQEVWRDGD